MSHPILSVVIATYERPDALRRLLGDLAAQDLSPDAFEVLVVDDGSRLPAIAAVADAPMPRATTFLRVPNGGPAVARDTGARRATGLLLVFLDDDMRVAPDFLAAHLAAHVRADGATVVLGNIAADPALATMPLFERFHARMLDRFKADVVAGRVAPRGVHLCTGNVSLRLADYLAVGGFDRSLRRSEDRDLGIRLERFGCGFTFAAAAVTVHGSDHRDVRAWRRRSEGWGRADVQIARRHPDRPDMHPWRFWSLIAPAARPVIGLTLALPTLGRVLGGLTYLLARLLDGLRLRGPALQLTTLAYAIDYFRGLRAELGGWRALQRARAQVRTGAAPAAAPRASAPMTSTALVAPTSAAPTVDGPPPTREWRALRHAVRADHAQLRALRAKYHGDVVAPGALGSHLVRKVGFQMLAVYRVMRWADARGLPLLAPVLSRLIRHLYGAELHWKARLAPGVAIVHGNGLVLSHGAIVGPGCLLFQNVTLGESRDPATGRVGAPRLEADVHVGPGAVLLGPITIGRGSKILAGSVVTEDVPSGSLVRPAASVVTSRSGVPTVA
jgi:serine acetyltransferase/GT2 family glycosyltransferase